MMRILLDVSDRRARIEGGVTLDLGSRRLPIDHVDLDTGSSVDVLVPLALVGRVPDEAVPTDPIVGIGGEVEAWTMGATLLRPDKQLELPVQVHFAHLPKGLPTTLGLPVLRRFDLLLRDATTDDAQRPALAFAPLR